MYVDGIVEIVAAPSKDKLRMQGRKRLCVTQRIL